MPPRKEHKIIENIEKKHCPTCDSWKSLDGFNKQSSSWDKLCRMCRECNIEYKRKKRETKKYKEKDEAYNKKYKESGRRKEKNQKWYEENKERIIQRMITYNKKKYHEDPYYKLTVTLRNRFGKTLREQLAKKSEKTLDILGCSIPFLMIHIEKQFEPGMTWDNHGLYTWHIDHKHACARFDLTDPEQQKKCFHYTNLQPLWAKDNLSKGSKIIENPKKVI